MLILLGSITQVKAQKAPTDSIGSSIYTGIYNQVKPQFPFPLLGFVNYAEGNQQHVQLGFTNLTADTFSGVQVGLVNKVGACNGGVQCGLSNLIIHQAIGLQVGMMNLAQANVNGAQLGFVNASLDSVNGAQVGYVNAVKGKVIGTQLGFVNATTHETKGVQVGYVNVTTNAVNGVQLGFVNIADSFSAGLPIGFLSIVKHGGYRAVELSMNETFRYNIACKVGVKPLYTLMQLSYQPDFYNAFATGFGLGSIMPLATYLRLNAELIHSQVISKHQLSFTQLNAGFQFGSAKWFIYAGPTLVWTYAENRTRGAEPTWLTSYKPKHHFYYEKVDAKNALHLGAKLGLNITF